MGREKRILLGLLGLLAGVFVGVLSKKLFVPRPPVGAGPDVDVRTAWGEPTELVEPPRLSLRAADFAAAPPLVAATAPERVPFPTESADLVARDPFAVLPPSGGQLTQAVAEEPPKGPVQPASMFARGAAADDFDDGLATDVAYTADTGIGSAAAFVHEADAPEQLRSAAIEPVPFEPVPVEPSGDLRPLAPAATPVAPPVSTSPAAGGAMPAAFAAGVLEAGSRGIPEAGSRGMHVAQPGDSWWSIAESVYGDGRLYRAVFAWNRAVDPRVSLAVGTRLELPPLDKLRAAWPALVPPAP